MIQRLLKILEADELQTLSGFLIDVAKGILGVPIVVYFLTGFSVVALSLGFMLDLLVVALLIIIAFKLKRIAKRRKRYE